jgi:hypothetical protein
VAPEPGTIVGVAIPLSAVGLVIMLLHLRSRLWTISPIAVILFAYLATAILGPLGLTGNGPGTVSAKITLTPDEVYQTFLIFVVAVGSLCVGALFLALLSPRTSIDLGSSKPSIGAPGLRRVVGLLAVVPLLLAVVGFGLDNLLFRASYSTTSAGDIVPTAGKILALPAVAIVSWLGKTSKSAISKVTAYSVVILYTVLLLSLSTRAFALVPLMVALGWLASNPRSARARWLMPLTAVSSILLLQTPLALRAANPYQHGLLPYVQTLFSGQDQTISVLNAVSNLLFSFALTGAVALHTSHLSASYFYLAIDPRLGQWTDWYLYQPELRINLVTPYNALGELANYGWPYLIAFFAMVGLIFEYFERRIIHLLRVGYPVFALLLFALCCYFVLESLQYNLRSASRVLYYLIAAEIGIRVILEVRHHSRGRSLASMAAAESAN